MHTVGHTHTHLLCFSYWCATFRIGPKPFFQDTLGKSGKNWGSLPSWQHALLMREKVSEGSPRCCISCSASKCFYVCNVLIWPGKSRPSNTNMFWIQLLCGLTQALEKELCCSSFYALWGREFTSKHIKTNKSRQVGLLSFQPSTQYTVKRNNAPPGPQCKHKNNTWLHKCRQDRTTECKESYT